MGIFLLGIQCNDVRRWLNLSYHAMFTWDFLRVAKNLKKNIHSPQKIFKTKSPRDTLGAREFFSWRSCDCERTTRGQNMKNLHFLRCTTYCKLYIVLYSFWRDQKIHLQNISKQKFHHLSTIVYFVYCCYRIETTVAKN